MTTFTQLVEREGTNIGLKETSWIFLESGWLSLYSRWTHGVTTVTHIISLTLLFTYWKGPTWYTLDHICCLHSWCHFWLGYLEDHVLLLSFFSFIPIVGSFQLPMQIFFSYYFLSRWFYYGICSLFSQSSLQNHLITFLCNCLMFPTLCNEQVSRKFKQKYY